jgi:hypothetical protein
MSVTNEEIIEEIITEAYVLGIYDELFIRFNKYKDFMDRSDAYQKSLYELKEEKGFTI